MAISERYTSQLLDWNRVFGPAIQAASRALTVWTQGRVSLTLDEVRELPLVELAEAIPGGDEVATVVSLDVCGDVGGQFLLTLDDEGASKLAALLLDRRPCSYPEWTELDRSALLETGNILGSAYLSALTGLTGLTLFPSPPTMSRDYLVCLLEQAVMVQAVENDEVLLVRTCFRHLNETIDWNMVFVPSPVLMNVLQTATLPRNG